MTKKKKHSTVAPWEHVLVRHMVESKRDDMDRVFSLVRQPFPDHGSSSCRGGSEDIEIYARAPDRWMIAAHFAGQNWLALFSNTASAKEMFDANAASRRLEVAWLRCRPQDEGWFIRLARGGKSMLEFAWPIAQGASPTFQSADLPENWLDQLSSPTEAFSSLCEHYDIQTPNRTIASAGRNFNCSGSGDSPSNRDCEPISAWRGRR